MNKIAKLLKLDRQIERLEFRQRADFLSWLTLTSRESGVEREPYNGPELVVSLTTYGRRIFDVSLTIESLMQQTMRPNRIVLWLADDMRDSITQSLRLQERRGLEIRFCEDLKSYKKLLPALEAFPDSVIVTVDDDALYYPDMLERLWASYLTAPKCVHALRVHRIEMASGGAVARYDNWDSCIRKCEISPLNVAVGVGGVLYPPHTFDSEVSNRERYMTLAPYADDIWFKAMELKNGVLVKKAPSSTASGEDYTNNPNVQEVALFRRNRRGGNDWQFKAVFSTYDLFGLLKEK